MRRRDFVTMLGGAATWPLAARGEQSRRLPVIGVLWHARDEKEEAPYLSAFRQGLNDLGYVESKNVILENRFAGERYERFNELAAELVRADVDVLVAVTRPAALAAQRATSTTPIVFILVPDPVASKLVDSLARPGRNITGVSQMALDLVAKRLQLLREAVVGLSSVAVLVNPSDAGDAQRYIDEARAAAGSLNVTTHSVEVGTPEDLDGAFSAIARDHREGVILTNDPMYFNERNHIGELAMSQRIPVISFSRPMAASGSLMSYGADVPTLFRRGAALAVRTLLGAKPADLPVELPTKFEFVINLKAARTLGLELPATLLARADEVIE
jgi:putative tryptophan/tyrosine transport system substrate-binding protein